MNHFELFEEIKAGNIKFDTFGHRTNFNSIDEYVQSFNEFKEDFAEFYTKRFELEIQDGDEIINKGRQTEFYCFCCGRRFTFSFNKNENSLELRNTCFDDPTARFGISRQNLPRCEFENLQPFKSQINVTSKLIFSNYFNICEDTPEGKEHSDEYCINCVSGRYEVAKYKSSFNVAYGQMTNCRIGVYVNSDNDEIILASNYSPEEMGYDIDQNSFSKHTKKLEKEFLVIYGDSKRLI